MIHGVEVYWLRLWRRQRRRRRRCRLRCTESEIFSPINSIRSMSRINSIVCCRNRLRLCWSVLRRAKTMPIYVGRACAPAKHDAESVERVLYNIVTSTVLLSVMHKVDRRTDRPCHADRQTTTTATTTTTKTAQESSKWNAQPYTHHNGLNGK